MRPDVVDRLGPRGEQLVQFRQVLELGGAGFGQLGQELAADSPEKSFYFSPALGPAGPAVDQLDAQLGAGPQQPRVDERRSVIGSAQVRVKVCTVALDVYGLASREASTVSAR
jgi:hypothetical protein